MDTSVPTRVHEIMSRSVAVLREEENLFAAEQGMKSFNFRHIPVVEGDKLVGLVTERDLLRASTSALHEDHDLLDDSLKRNFFVREIMVTTVRTVRPDTTLVDALELMCRCKLGCLPVTTLDGTLVGIVTRSDFLNVTLELFKGERSRFEAMRSAVG
jgi:CBS domain-containing protein